MFIGGAETIVLNHGYDPSTSKINHDERQRQHEKSCESYDAAIVKMSNKLEEVVILQSRELSRKMGDIDRGLDAVHKDLLDDTYLRTQEYNYIDEAKNRIDAFMDSRRNTIDAFDAQMKNIETKRSKSAGKALHNLVVRLTDVAYVLRGDIERLVEKESSKINLVMLGNFR